MNILNDFYSEVVLQEEYSYSVSAIYRQIPTAMDHNVSHGTTSSHHVLLKSLGRVGVAVLTPLSRVMAERLRAPDSSSGV